MKEKRKEKKSKSKVETKPEVEKVEEETKTETVVTEKERTPHRPEVIIKEDVVETATEDQQTTDDTAEIEPEVIVAEVFLPQWGDSTQSEWMYHVPPREDDKDLWAQEWGDFLLEWAQEKGLHVLSVSTFLEEVPFSEMLGKVDAFRLIGDSLVEKEVADWLDRGRRQLRVYWRPLEEWADIVYEWALKTGNLLLDLKSIVIQESGQDFAQLPERDIGIVLGFIVEKELAVWVDKKKHAIRIEI
jgi:hypothetical protein